MTARQAFTGDVLGIRINDSILPFGNTPGVLAPYLLRSDYVFTQTP